MRHVTLVATMSAAMCNLSKVLKRITTSKAFLRLIISVIVLLFFIPSTAEAHRPAFPDDSNKSATKAFQLDDIDISQAIYQILNQNEQLWLSFDPKNSSTKTAINQLGIPILEETKSFRPMVAVVSKSLNKIDLPFDIPDGFGATLYETASEDQIKKFHEPFTNTDSWILIEDKFEITEPNIHYIVIFSKTNQTGKLWFATGTREVFGLSAISDLNKNISKVKTFHKPSAISISKPAMKTEESVWQTRLKNIDYFKSSHIYLISGLILILLIFVSVKKKTKSK